MTRHRPLAMLAGLALGAATYGSLVPLRLRDDASWASAVEQLRSLPFEPARVLWSGDFFVNVLVLYPLGFFLCGALWSRGHRAVRAVLLTTIACVCVAGVLEFAQLFVRYRTSSWSDVFALSLGAGAGALSWAACGPALMRALSTATATAGPGARLRGLLVLYLAGWIGVGLLPLLFPRFAYPLPRAVWLRSFADPGVALTLVHGLWSAVAVAPLGAAVAVLTGRRAWWQRAAVLVAATAAVCGLDDLRQITPGVTPPDRAARLAGLGAGAWFMWSAAGRALARDGVRDGASAGRWPAMALAAWCGLLLLQAWAPFDFGVASRDFDLRVRILYERAPLSRYYWAPPLLALQMVLTVLLSALPLGALLCELRGRDGRMLSDATAVWLAVAFFTALEAGQLYLPAHRADPTDVLIAAAGAFIGVRLARAVAA